MSRVILYLPRVVTAGSPFDISAEIEGAAAGAKVNVVVKKSLGPSNWTGDDVEIQTDSSGAGGITMDGVVLDKAGQHVLVAAASDDHDDYFAVDAKSLKAI